MTNVALFWNAFLSLVLVFQSQLELKHDASELTSPWPLTLTFKFFSPYFMAVVSISSVSFQAWLCVERPFCLPVQRCVLLEAVQQVSTRHSTSLRCVAASRTFRLANNDIILILWSYNAEQSSCKVWLKARGKLSTHKSSEGDTFFSWDFETVGVLQGVSTSINPHFTQLLLLAFFNNLSEIQKYDRNNNGDVGGDHTKHTFVVISC